MIPFKCVFEGGGSADGKDLELPVLVNEFGFRTGIEPFRTDVYDCLHVRDDRGHYRFKWRFQYIGDTAWEPRP